MSNRPDEVRDLIGEWAGPLADLVPEIGPILRPHRYERATADVERRRAFEAVTSFLRSLARRRPLLLFLDDLQNAGSSTLELLHFAVRRTTGARLLILATVRSEEGDEVEGHLRDVSDTVDIGPLPTAAVAELAADRGLGDRAEQIMAVMRCSSPRS